MNNRLQNYRICEKRIGKGSFSTIYKCFDISNNVRALKKIDMDKLKNKKSIKNEFNIMRKLSHINIIKVFDLIIDDTLNNVYIFMEYFENGDLGKYLGGNALEEKNVNNFSIQIKNGLQYLYTQNIVHRDIKPQNILVSNDKILKIIDFGLSKNININNEMMDTICGSPLYMAPEIIKTKNYTIKSDIWSFGVIIYEMIYGYTPFRATNIYNLIKTIDNYDIKYPSNTISFDCIDLLQKMLKKNPHDRIDWHSLFLHPWLVNDLVLNEENKLLEIPFKSHTGFNTSFRYKSISNKIDNSFEFKFSIDSIGSSSSLYHSFSDSDTDTEYLYHSESDLHNLSPKKGSKPIDIIQNNDIQDSFVFVNKNGLETPQSPIMKSFSDNLKGYINNSIHFVKQSCDYINKSSSL